MACPDEQSLISAVTSGDRAALGELLSQNQQRLYNIVYRMLGHHDDASEVTQEAMLKIVENIGSFRGQSNITTWMIRIAMNQSISHLRRQRHRRTMSLDTGENRGATDTTLVPLGTKLAESGEPTPVQNVQHLEMVQTLHIALSRLDDDFRSVLVLRDIDQMDYRQIAETLDLAIGTVKSRLFRARLALRQEMFKLCPSERPDSASAGRETSDPTITAAPIPHATDQAAGGLADA